MLWEARFVVFYEGLRLSGGRMSNHVLRLGGSAKERPSRAWGQGEGGGGTGIIMGQMTWDHMSSSGHHVRCKWKKVQHT